MARNFYQVTLNGKDMPGIRWAMKDTARFSIKVEAEITLEEMIAAHPDENYRLEHDDNWDWADLIHTVRTGYGEPLQETKSHVYGIRVGEVGEERKCRYVLAMDYASK